MNEIEKLGILSPISFDDPNKIDWFFESIAWNFFLIIGKGYRKSFIELIDMDV